MPLMRHERHYTYFRHRTATDDHFSSWLIKLFSLFFFFLLLILLYGLIHSCFQYLLQWTHARDPHGGIKKHFILLVKCLYAFDVLACDGPSSGTQPLSCNLNCQPHGELCLSFKLVGYKFSLRITAPLHLSLTKMGKGKWLEGDRKDVVGQV